MTFGALAHLSISSGRSRCFTRSPLPDLTCATQADGGLLFVSALMALLIGLLATVEPAGVGLLASITVVASVAVWGPLALASANKGTRKGVPKF